MAVLGHRIHNCVSFMVSSPYIQMELMDIEKIERVEVDQNGSGTNSSYEARLRRLNLPTLKYRRLRGDMILVYNIVSGKYPTVNFNLCNVLTL